MKVMILAAGRGLRLRPLTDSTPKPLLEVKGKPLIVHHLERLRAAGFSEIVINLAWLGNLIKSFLSDGSGFGVRIHYSEEPEGALETGGGVLKALPLLGSEAFLIVNADVLTDFPFETLKTALRDGDLAHLVMVQNPPHHPQGDFHLDSSGHLLAEGTPRLTYAGIGVHHPDFFRDCVPGRFPLLPWWQKAMQAKRVSGQRYSGFWNDIGTTDGLRAIS
ncbi:MAG: nucleotidyltransferase family protein [Gammaproteobacteria bacterium]